MKPSIGGPWMGSAVICLFTTFAAQALMTSPPEAPVKAEVRLTGITTLSGNKRAWLSVQEPGADSKTPGVNYACTLSEGEASGSVAVVQIDEATGRVVIRNGEEEEHLTFARNGVSAPVLPASACIASAPASYRPVPQPVVVYPSAPRYVAPCVSQNQLIVINSGACRTTSFSRSSFRSSNFGTIGSSSCYGSNFRIGSHSYRSPSYGRSYSRSSYNSCRPSVSYGRASCGTRSWSRR